MIEPTAKQKLLISITGDIANTIVYGGARGGGKTFGVSGMKSVLEVVEKYTEYEIRKDRIDVTGFRDAVDSITGIKTYFKYCLDYPDYIICIVRKTESQLLSNTKVETDRTYPHFGGKWHSNISGMKCAGYVFPSGAKVLFRPVNKKEHLEFFRGPSFAKLIIEELTQFDEDWVDEMETSVRGNFANGKIIPQKIYTTNPGGRGHSWVRRKFIKTCPPVTDGDPIYYPEYDLTYQPTTAGKVYVTKAKNRYMFLPSLVFDNPYLSEFDKDYVRNLIDKPDHIKRMYLFGDWDVFVGQFFDMWDEKIHVGNQMKFFGAINNSDLEKKMREFNWSDYRLYLSNDYGYSKTSAWACGAYAEHRYTGNIVKFDEIVENNMTINEQASYTVDYFMKTYNISPNDWELVIGDPNSYFKRHDKGMNFYTFADVYQEHGLYMDKGINDREAGAMCVADSLKPDKNGNVRLTFLDNCVQNIESFPNLPCDDKDPNKVSKNVFDHPYDETRYLLMVLIYGVDEKPKFEKKMGLKDRMLRKLKGLIGTYQGKPKTNSWRAA